jgi:dATP/dGTP pyrophosphohydrolase
MLDLVLYIRSQIDFSREAFGPGSRLAGVLDHLAKEMIEVTEHPQDPLEWADLIILAIDGAWRQGITPEDLASALVVKQNMNRARTWPDWRTAPADRAIEHQR